MPKSKVTDTVRKIALPIANRHGCDLFDVEYKKEGADYVLRVYIEKQRVGEYISIDDCEAVSKELSDRLDEADPIANPYLLEVSSPGIDRPLRNRADFEKYMGSAVEVGLYQAMDGCKTLAGTLAGFDGQTILLNTETGEKAVLFKDAAYVKLAVKF